MKPFLLALLVVTACRSANDAAILEHEAIALAKYYWPKLEAIEPRLQDVYKRGQTIPETVAGFNEGAKRYAEARELWVQLKNQFGPGPDGKSSLERQAAAAAKENRIETLEQLIHDAETKAEEGLTVINADLSAVESWIAEYDRAAKAAPPTGAAKEEAQRPAPTPTSRQPAPPTTAQPGQPATPTAPQK